MCPIPSVTTPDVYIAPTATDPGTGFTPFDAAGHPIRTIRSPVDAEDRQFRGPISSGWFQALALPNADGSPGTGGDDYRNNIANCNPNVFQIGDTIPTEQGNMIGPTKQGVTISCERIQAPPGTRPQIAFRAAVRPGVCADGQYHARSPRIVPVVLFDIDASSRARPTARRA